MTDPRSIWLRTLSGTPDSFVWALVKLEADCTTPNVSWECALDAATHPTASGWDATTTVWRSVPPLLYPDSFALGTTLAGRIVTVAGCTFDLDVSGRPNPSGGEKLPPDTTVGTIETLVAHIETLGRDMDFIEKTTLKRCRVYTTQPVDPYDGGAVQSAFYRQTADSIAVRNDAP